MNMAHFVSSICHNLKYLQKIKSFLIYLNWECTYHLCYGHKHACFYYSCINQFMKSICLPYAMVFVGKLLKLCRKNDLILYKVHMRRGGGYLQMLIFTDKNIYVAMLAVLFQHRHYICTYMYYESTKNIIIKNH